MNLLLRAILQPEQATVFPQHSTSNVPSAVISTVGSAVDTENPGA